MKKKNITNHRHFQIFCKDVHKWLEFFGMRDWDVSIIHGKIPGLEGVRAAFRGDPPSRNAIVALYPDWGPDPVTDMRIRKSAIHEIVHLMLCDLSSYAVSRFTSEENIDEAEEIIVKRIEKAMFPRNRVEINIGSLGPDED